MRTPISWVRWDTEYDTTPYVPVTMRRSAVAAKRATRSMENLRPAVASRSTLPMVKGAVMGMAASMSRTAVRIAGARTVGSPAVRTMSRAQKVPHTSAVWGKYISGSERLVGPHWRTFSTIPTTLARQYASVVAEVNVSRDQLTVGEVSQYYVTAERHDKDRLLKLLLEHDRPESLIVFTNTKHAARKLAQKLFRWNVDAMEIHGDLMQRKRDKVMDRFRKHRVKVLVATDLAARGIDVHHVTHIINYDLPVDIQTYVHRIGRTARMGAQGKAVSFVTREEGKLLTDIEKLINKQIVECSYPGFEPSPPHEKPRYAPTTAKEPLSTAVPATATAQSTLKRRPLGGRFKPSRRRR